MLQSKRLQERRGQRVRGRVKAKAGHRPRLSVFRSNKNIYAQLIDDGAGTTICAASTLEKDLRGTLKVGCDKEAAAAVGRLIAERATTKGIRDVVFDRGPYMFHGRVKALADAAREGGLSF